MKTRLGGAITLEMLASEYVRKLNRESYSDPGRAHFQADEVLLAVLETLGYGDLCKAFREIQRNYEPLDDDSVDQEWQP